MRKRTWLFGSSVLVLLSILVVVGVVAACSNGSSPSPVIGVTQHQTPTPTPTSTPTPTPTPTPGPFTLQISMPTSGQILSQGASIDCNGTYTGQYPPYVWVVLVDTRGQFYLQNPPVTFSPNATNSGGTWDASNVIPGSGIIRIVVVQVDMAGNATFENMVNNGKFGAFPRLPDGSTPLVRVSIQVQ